MDSKFQFPSPNFWARKLNLDFGVWIELLKISTWTPVELMVGLLNEKLVTNSNKVWRTPKRSWSPTNSERLLQVSQSPSRPSFCGCSNIQTPVAMLFPLLYYSSTRSISSFLIFIVELGPQRSVPTWSIYNKFANMWFPKCQWRHFGYNFQCRL